MFLTNSCGLKASKVELEKYSFDIYDAFNTVTIISAYLQSEEEKELLKAETKDFLMKYNDLFDIYNDAAENNIKSINDKAGVEAVEVSPEIIELLEFAINEYYETNGSVNIAMGAVLKLWHNAREVSMEDGSKAYIPDEQSLKEASKHCNIEDIIIDKNNNTVFLNDKEMSLDVGSVAKGYTIELLAQKYKAEGRDNIIISAGGNVKTVGIKPSKEKWNIAIRNPEKQLDDPYALTLSLGDNISVVTSGTYERYFTFNGIRYHHIINQNSLMPENDYVSVSIITPDSGVADALSTAVFNMSLEEGMEFIEKTTDTEAMWILSNNERYYSSGFEEMISK